MRPFLISLFHHVNKEKDLEYMSFFNGGAVSNEVLHTGDPTHQLPGHHDYQYPDDRCILIWMSVVIYLSTQIW